MARNKTVDFVPAQRAPFLKRTNSGLLAANTTNSPRLAPWSKDNTFEERARNNGNTDDIRVWSVNASDQLMFGEALAAQERKSVQWQVQDNASISSQGFFIVNAGESYRVTGITWEHTTQSSVAGTAYVEKTPSGTAVGSGTSLMSGTFALSTIANATVTNATLATTGTGDSDAADLQLAAGDKISVVIAGTVTSLAGVTVTVFLAPTGKSVRTTSYFVKANADMVQAQYFFTAPRPMVVSAVSMNYTVKSSVSGLKLTVTKDTGTTAPGAGTSILTDNTNAGPLVTQTANATYAGALSATAATIRLATGDRLAIKFNGGTLTALVGLVVTVSFVETAANRVEKTFFLDHIPGQTDLTGWVAGSFWTADRDYEVLDINFCARVATGGAAKCTITTESGTTAAGSGTVLNTANTNAGFDLNATAATTQYATLPTVLGSRILLAGDRLSVKPSGTLTTGAGVVMTVSLAPR